MSILSKSLYITILNIVSRRMSIDIIILLFGKLPCVLYFLFCFTCLLVFSLQLKNILKIYPVLKCTTSFSNIFHRNGYAIRPYILPFRIQFRTELLHKYTHSHTSSSITHIYIQFIEGLNKVY